MRIADNGTLRKHIYKYHRFVSGSRIIVLTNNALVAIKKAAVASTQSGDWVIDWQLPLSRLQSPELVEPNKMHVFAFDDEWRTYYHSIKSEQPDALRDIHDHLELEHAINTEVEYTVCTIGRMSAHAMRRKTLEDIAAKGESSTALKMSRKESYQLMGTSKSGWLNKLQTEGINRGFAFRLLLSYNSRTQMEALLLHGG